METDFIIIGGGVAGLASAIRLTELGASPIVIEAGNYPSHKVCGEFFSPACIPILHKWEIEPILISQVTIHSQNNTTINYKFPKVAGSLSHRVVDPLLAKRAEKGGAKIFTEVRALEFKHDSKGHRIILSNGDEIIGKNLIISQGRISTLSIPKKNCYIGFKSHYAGISISDLQMFLFPGAYLGISPIEEKKVNIACLAKIEQVNEFDNPQDYINDLVKQNGNLKKLIANANPLFDEWMFTQIPEFGIRDIPPWPQTYWIGDAGGSIPPISGRGLELALKGGIMAAEYAVRDRAQKFRVQWIKDVKKGIRASQWVQHALMVPFLGNVSIYFGQKYPSLVTYIYNSTRDREQI